MSNLNMEKKKIHVVSFSGGKDSTAMLLMMLERNMPIDSILWVDTGMEFPEIYRHIERLDQLLYEQRGIHITKLKHPQGFEWVMLEEPKKKLKTVKRRIKKGMPVKGNGWPKIRVRWCTGKLKLELLHKAVRQLEREYDAEAVQYVGIAYDERHRCKDLEYPLVKWKVTETEALQYCYEHGFDWEGLYRIYHRSSCWCCPFQRIGELRALRKHHPELWKRLLEMDAEVIEAFGNTTAGTFKNNSTVEDLEKRFANEEMAA